MRSRNFGRGSGCRVAEDLYGSLKLSECCRFVDSLFDDGVIVTEETFLLLCQRFLASDETGLRRAVTERTASLVNIVALLKILTIERLHHSTNAFGLLRFALLHAASIEIHLVVRSLDDVAVSDKHITRNLQELRNDPGLGLELHQSLLNLEFEGVARLLLLSLEAFFFLVFEHDLEKEAEDLAGVLFVREQE